MRNVGQFGYFRRDFLGNGWYCESAVDLKEWKEMWMRHGDKASCAECRTPFEEETSLVYFEGSGPERWHCQRCAARKGLIW